MIEILARKAQQSASQIQPSCQMGRMKGKKGFSKLHHTGNIKRLPLFRNSRYSGFFTDFVTFSILVQPPDLHAVSG